MAQLKNIALILCLSTLICLSAGDWCQLSCSKKGCIDSVTTDAGGCICKKCGYDTTECTFPFTWGLTSYESCIEVNSVGRPWCSTEATYLGNYKYCISLETINWCELKCGRKGCIGWDKSNGACVCKSCGYDVKDCVFPFKWGTTNYFNCIDLNKSGRPWCSTSKIYLGDFKYCQSTESINWCELKCAKKGCIGSDKSKEVCTCQDCGHNVEGCALPFKWGLTEYFSCTTANSPNGRPWCSTDAVYTGSSKYCDTLEKYHWCELRCAKRGCLTKRITENDECICSTCTADVSGCVFPFTWGKTTYFSCTDEGSKGRPWCSTDAAYVGNSKYC